ncbi:MAG TPA: class I SAM-dependent methyltransferase [Myxococcota bacterium]|nr:class I SAM-dependent methyltransferase [Myxococcota bacterium]
MLGPRSAVQRRALRLFRSVWRTRDQASLIRRLLADLKPGTQRPVVLVETGCGLSTLALAEVAERVGGYVYSCELDPRRIDALRSNAPDALERVHFVAGDSLASLERIAARHEAIDFALFDSAPSATHILHEFQALERRLNPGARILIDEAALPGARLLLGPCRKGKLVVPYLLASPVWRVSAFPRASNSMVSAVHDRVGARADASYEDPSYAAWREALGEGLQPVR